VVDNYCKYIDTDIDITIFGLVMPQQI